MNPERWQQIDQLLQSALEQEPGQRSAFLAQACADDEPLRWEIESLIASHEKEGNILEKPLSEVAAQLLINQARLAEGQRIGRYQVMALLGEGGMGEVYLVQDTMLGRQVALKLLPTQFTRDADRLRRFEQEAHAASALNHPNIITIHEIGQLDGAHFIVTEFIEGQTLRHATSGAPLNVREVLDVTSQVASALAAAHAAGIVHRDIKPENIMRRHDGFVKVLDFGLAKLTLAAKVESDAPTKALVNTNPGMVIGTVQYMSPEQARGGQELDARTDIWSLGVVLYEMIAGNPPFDGETPSHVIVSILQDDFAPLGRSTPEVPVELERIVSKALQKNREERYQTVKELATDLLSLKQELEVDARLERSIRSETSDGEKTAAKKVSQLANVTPNKSASRTVDVGTAHPTSSAEDVINEIKRHKRSVILVASAIAIAVVAYSYVFYFAKPRGPVESIAVLPLVNVNADPNTEYLSDGISESIVNSLTPLPNLNVKSLSSVLRYKGRQIDPQTAGHELGVRAVVTGRLFQHDDELSINIELVDVVDNRRLWGKQYDRKVADVLVVQKEISQEISEKLRPKLSGQEGRQSKNYTENKEAYQAFLKGRYHFNKRTAEELSLGNNFFQQAIDMDRNYSVAYAGLALSYATLGRRGTLLPIEAYPKASAAASRALEIDETLADAHNAQGMVKMDFARDFAGAEKEFKRAIELDPMNTDAHHAYSHFLVALGRTEESLGESRRALEIDPLNLVMNSHLAWHYLFAREYDQAIKQGRQTLDMGEDYWAHLYLGQAYEQTKRYDEAIAEFKKAINMSPTSTEANAALGYAYAISGRNAEAKLLITELNESAKNRYVSLGYQAIIDAGLGEKQQALKWLQEAFEERAGWLVYLNVDPRYDSLRSDPKFKELLRRMKLVQA